MTPSEPSDIEGEESSPGRIVAAPSVSQSSLDDVPVKSKTDLRAERMFLTGRAAEMALTLTSKSPTQLAWREFRKNRLAVASLAILVFMYLVAIFAQFIAPYDYTSQDNIASFRPPIAIHWLPQPTVYAQNRRFDKYHFVIYTDNHAKPEKIGFFVHGTPYKFWGFIPADLHLFGVEGHEKIYVLGTDQFGRDYLSRILFASQISLSVGLIGITLTLVLGMLVGGISGYYGGWIDDAIMRLCEVIMSVPDFYLLLALAAALPPTLSPVVVYLLIIGILSLIGFASMARIIRGMVLSVREREYVEAARSLGVNDLTIIVRHIIPSTYTFAIVTATLSIPGYILSEASLSFLGLGIRDPMASWGNMLSAAEDLSSLEQRMWLLIPGLLIFITTLTFNFLGDGLRDALDPKSR
jgi:peptide/nickel transport system permease protein